MTTTAVALSGEITFQDQSVRSVMLDGEPWFSAPDVCAVLELTNPTMAVQHLAAEHKRVVRKGDQTPSGLVCSSLFPGRVSRHTVITEAGLYRLVMRSDKPSAVAFQNHLAEHVIPSLRKHGGYIAGQEALTEEDVAEIIAGARQGVLSRREENEACFGPEMKRLFRTRSTLTPAQRRAIAHKNAAAQRTPRGPSDPF
jgi:anti-repressor protein